MESYNQGPSISDIILLYKTGTTTKFSNSILPNAVTAYI